MPPNQVNTWNRRLTFRVLKNVNNSKSIHGIYPYRGKISAVDARQVIRQLPQTGTLLDPFCGSGTIVFEAREWSINAIGIDNNPIAIILTKAKLEKNDLNVLKSHATQLISEAKTLQSVPKMPESPQKYFHPETADQIMRMNQLAIADKMNYYELACFYGSICLAARGCNHYMWSSTNIGKIFEPHLRIDFYQKFYNKIVKHYAPLISRAQGQVYHYDSRSLSEIIPENSINYVFSSPPYFDALDYTSYYTRLVYEIIGYNRGEIRSRLIQSIDKYEDDMKQVLDEIDKVTKDDAIIIFVVGDKKVRDRVINGGEFFAKISKYKPTYVVERNYTGTASKIWDSINKTNRKEQIIVWDKEMKR
jgi:DNA modification methylase